MTAGQDGPDRLRLCLSAAPWCSTLDPCEACAMVFDALVLRTGEVALPAALVMCGASDEATVARAIDVYREKVLAAVKVERERARGEVELLLRTALSDERTDEQIVSDVNDLAGSQAMLQEADGSPAAVPTIESTGFVEEHLRGAAEQSTTVASRAEVAANDRPSPEDEPASAPAGEVEGVSAPPRPRGRPRRSRAAKKPEDPT